MSDQPLAGSEASTSALSAQECASCGKPKSTSGADECCAIIGPTRESTTMLESSDVESVIGCLTPFPEIGEAIRIYSVESGQPTVKKQPPLISSAEDSLAKTSASQASAPALRVSAAASSLSSQGSQMSFGHDGLSLKTSLGSSPLPTAETLESFSQRWGKSGLAARGEHLTLDSLEFPSGAVECSLSDVLEMTVGERYALSARAARGILRRADARGRTLPSELRQALETLAA